MPGAGFFIVRKGNMNAICPLLKFVQNSIIFVYF
jgi:hypothetical protein